jgi:Zn-dependent protease
LTCGVAAASFPVLSTRPRPRAPALFQDRHGARRHASEARRPLAAPLPLARLEFILLVAPVLLFSVIAHEIAHGYAALKQGDPTAKQLGRLTWNPLKHIDPWMTILLPALLLYTTGTAIGGAKPVPVNPRNYRDYKRGDIIVSLAGVATNLVIAVACALLMLAVGALWRSAGVDGTALAVLQVILFNGVWVNMSLIAFNLLPIPPLDGSHVMKYLLPPAWSQTYQRIGFFGIFLLLLLVNTSFFRWWMTPVIAVADWVLTAAQRLGLLLPGFGQWLR